MTRLTLVSMTVLLGACEPAVPGAAPGAPAVNTHYGATCAAYVADMGVTTPSGPCVGSKSFTTPGGIAGTELGVRADCADPSGTISGNLDKRHVVMAPNTGAAGLPLWVHLGGTAGKPTNTENIGEAAVDAGYRYISLAYLNNVSVSDRCTCPSRERRAGNCNEEVRLELLTGDDFSADFDMDPEESIENRLAALLYTLDQQYPAGGWDAYYDLSTHKPLWEEMAISGFSQGGGMAGLIARDHEVDRVLYFSKGVGQTVNIVADPSVADVCTAPGDCSGDQQCCPLDEFDETCAVNVAKTNYCLEQVVAPWGFTGEDTDGDGFGDGDETTRATPASRSYALVHEDENAWDYSPDVFDAWGLGAPSTFVDADPGGPFGASDRLFSTDTPPPAGTKCSEHQSMGADGCQPKSAGVPIMYDAWIHAMTN